MKYMLLNDIKTLKKLKVVLIYYLVLILSSIIMSSNNLEAYEIILGLKLEKNIIFICLFIINVFINIYITSMFFLSDIENPNLFLRIKYKKWLIYKIFFITFVIILLRIIAHLIVAYLCKSDLVNLDISILFNLVISYIIILVLRRFYDRG